MHRKNKVHRVYKRTLKTIRYIGCIIRLLKRGETPRREEKSATKERPHTLTPTNETSRHGGGKKRQNKEGYSVSTSPVFEAPRICIHLRQRLLLPPTEHTKLFLVGGGHPACTDAANGIKLQLQNRSGLNLRKWWWIYRREDEGEGKNKEGKGRRWEYKSGRKGGCGEEEERGDRRLQPPSPERNSSILIKRRKKQEEISWR